jgi:hypothetical protein
MYQIRKYKEVVEDIVPARIYYLNQLYALRFLKNGSLNEAISLTKDSLDLLKKYIAGTSNTEDELVPYYHTSTWYQLVVSKSRKTSFMNPQDLYIMYAQEQEREFHNYYGGRILLQSAFSDYPPNLDPFNIFLNKLVNEIYRLYLVDPETAPTTGAPITESEGMYLVSLDSKQL